MMQLLDSLPVLTNNLELMQKPGCYCDDNVEAIATYVEWKKIAV